MKAFVKFDVEKIKTHLNIIKTAEFDGTMMWGALEIKAIMNAGLHKIDCMPDDFKESIVCPYCTKEANPTQKYNAEFCEHCKSILKVMS